MNIIVQNRRNVEFDLADLEVQVKDFIDDNSVVVRIAANSTDSTT